MTEALGKIQLRHSTGPFSVSPVSVLTGGVSHRFRHCLYLGVFIRTKNIEFEFNRLFQSDNKVSHHYYVVAGGGSVFHFSFRSWKLGEEELTDSILHLTHYMVSFCLFDDLDDHLCFLPEQFLRVKKFTGGVTHLK